MGRSGPILQLTTVKKYVNRIFSKLGVEDRVQATLRFHQHADRANGRPPLSSGTDGKMRK